MKHAEPAIKAPIDPNHPSYYLDKTEMNRVLKEYKDACELAEKQGKEIPGAPEYIGECFLRIARGLAMKQNFRNYSYLNEMISDGVITCLRYVRSYDPDRKNEDTGMSTSALSYFTQCCHYAFLGRIKLEQKQNKIKRALVYSADLDTFSTQDEDAGEFHMNLQEFLAGLGKDEVEDMMPEKKVKPVKPGGLEGFLE
jgi:hypothetical protein